MDERPVFPFGPIMSYGRAAILNACRLFLVAFTIGGLCIPALPITPASPQPGPSSRARTTSAFKRVRVLLGTVKRLVRHNARPFACQHAAPHPAWPELPPESSSPEPPPLSESELPESEAPADPEPLEPTPDFLFASRLEHPNIPDHILPVLPSSPRPPRPASLAPRAQVLRGSPSRTLPIRLARFTC